MGTTRAVATEAEIAARVAHQINNPLTAVIANLDVALSEIASLARDLDSCAAIQERLHDARAAAERLHRTVRELAATSSVPPWTASLTPVSQRAEASGPVRRGRVLVVDDEHLIMSAVQRTLSLDHEVKTSSRGSEALDQLRCGARFDLILCDLMMPEMNGIELYAEIARIAPDQALRIVFLTGGPCTALAQDFLCRAPNARIEKPFDARRLRALVADHMRAHDAV